MEPWEALDIDDSDISSFLRPCKRHHRDRSTDSPLKTTDTAATTSQSQPNHQLNPQSSTETLANSQSLLHFPEPEPSAPSPCLIPGPAGAVQAAMQRRVLGDHGFNRMEGEPLPTQEFIRRVVENGDEHDHDFNTNAWLCALDFLRRGGMIVDYEGEAFGTPLSSIKEHLNVERVGQVVAVIKSCIPNGLGGLMLTLKDPTSTIGASVHHKVFTKEEFAKDICVGSVVVLQKVAVFFPTCSACYLNITLPNIVKVFSKDSGPPSEQIYPAASVRRTAPNMESKEKLWMLGDTFSLPQERTEGIMSSLRLNRERVDIDRQQDKALGINHLENGNGRDQNDVPERTEGIMSSLGLNRERVDIDTQKDKALGSNRLDNGNSRDQNGVPDIKSLSQRQGEYTRIARPVEVILDGELDSGKPSKLGEGSIPTWIGQDNGSSAKPVDISDGQEIGMKTRNEGKAEIPIRKSLIPHWTEEQLDELLAFE
ncbi:hypothetical protein L6164_005417 [Bauhinia variegata]|uniref:Uncharacterized protein n=1 Tax=Bauhinia variegata TaxID=167791 RepID=A0ACB9PQT3_BAUVA|nr:hypothetical protein L6164_005417 [Bauhinia variegata]